MSSIRAIFKNDNFYFASQKQDQKKQEQRQKKQKELEKTGTYILKATKAQKKQQFIKKQAQLKDQQIFFKNYNNGDFWVGTAFSAYAKAKVSPDSDRQQIQEVKNYLKQKNQQKQQSLNNSQEKVNTEKQPIRENSFLLKDQTAKKVKDDQDDDFKQILQQLQKDEDEKSKKIDSSKQSFKFNHFSHQPKSTLKIKSNDAECKKLQSNKVEKSLYQLKCLQKKQDKNLKQQIKKDQIENPNNQEKKNPQKNKKLNRKIKKVKNYQILDLKRKYQDKFVGKIRQIQRMYQRNGALKPKYRKLPSELQIQNGEIYNNFIHSLSSSFHINISLDSDSEEQEQIQRNIEIPTIQESSQERLSKFIQEMFGFSAFRQGQYDVINNILNYRSTIFVSETASGKSLTYIISSLIMSKHLQGMSIVISPLIALMLDQLEHLPDELPAACISSLINYEQRDKILQLIKAGQVKLLFMTPEMLNTDILFHLRQFPPINFVCIDEAHCLSELSHNFRNSYIALSEIIKNHIIYNTPDSSPNILCLTATANNETIQSLFKKLNINQVIKSSTILNKNLYITITRQIGSQSKFRALVDYLSITQIKSCRAIMIYCRSKWLIEKVFYYLSNSNIQARIFHGSLTSKEKTQIITDFKNQSIKIIVSTTALGMGLDFEHLDCIIHFNMAKSLESFVQQIGRAGRRQNRAYCHLFLDEQDFFMERNFILADQLQDQSMRIIVNQIQKSINQKKNKRQGTQRTKKKNQPLQEQMERVIKRASISIQKIQNADDENQDFLIHQCESIQLNEPETRQKDHKAQSLCYIKAKELAQKTFLREEALLVILINIAEQLNFCFLNEKKDDALKIYPLSHQTLKLSFFKSNEKKLIESEEHGQFFKQLVSYNEKQKKSQCKKVSGGYMIDLIEKCNLLQITPIQLMSKVYEISNEYKLKVQFINQVYVFCINTNAGIFKNMSKRQIKNKVTEKIQNRQFHKDVINKVNNIQNTSMTKLEVFYSLAFNFSQITVNQLIKKKMVIDHSKTIPKQNIMNEITKYFNTNINTFYSQLTETDSIQERQIYLPTENVEKNEIQGIYDNIKLFFKHQYSNFRDLNSQKEILKRKQAIFDEYKDGKVITRVFLGVNEQKSSRLIFGLHSYWKKFLKKKYFHLLNTVRGLIQKNKEDLINC